MATRFGLKEHPIRAEAGRVLAAVVRAAREPALYGSGRVPDTFDGRFQLAALHAALVFRRLRAAGDGAALAQAFSDGLFQHFDEGLREAGVGDLSVAKHMKKMGQAFFGRLAVYDAALTAGDRPALAAALSGNIWDLDAAPFAPALADRAFRLAAALDAAPTGALAAAQSWLVEER